MVEYLHGGNTIDPPVDGWGKKSVNYVIELFMTHESLLCKTVSAVILLV